MTWRLWLIFAIAAVLAETLVHAVRASRSRK